MRKAPQGGSGAGDGRFPSIGSRGSKLSLKQLGPCLVECQSSFFHPETPWESFPTLHPSPNHAHLSHGPGFDSSSKEPRTFHGRFCLLSLKASPLLQPSLRSTTARRTKLQRLRPFSPGDSCCPRPIRHRLVSVEINSTTPEACVRPSRRNCIVVRSPLRYSVPAVSHCRRPAVAA